MNYSKAKVQVAEIEQEQSREKHRKTEERGKKQQNRRKHEWAKYPAVNSEGWMYSSSSRRSLKSSVCRRVSLLPFLSELQPFSRFSLGCGGLPAGARRCTNTLMFYKEKSGKAKQRKKAIQGDCVGLECSGIRSVLLWPCLPEFKLWAPRPKTTQMEAGDQSSDGQEEWNISDGPRMRRN